MFNIIKHLANQMCDNLTDLFIRFLSNNSGK